MSFIKIIALLILCLGSIFGCHSSPRQATQESDSIQILDSMVLDSVPADFPVGFATLFRNDRQYVAYYNKNRYMTIASRHLNDKQWQYKVLPTRVGWDSHNSIVMTMDKNNCLHVSGNMHNDTLIYFVTSLPEDISSFERILPLVNLEEELSCTYPSFIKDADGELYFSYRIGGSGNGITILNRYDHELRSFERLSDKPLFDGLGKMSAYKSGPRLGPDGYFHVIWLWRDTPACETNHDLSYARSKDLVHWQAPGKEQTRLTISPDESLFTVDPVPAGGGAINGNIRLFFNQKNQALIAYLKYDERGYSQIYLASKDQGQWNSKKVSDWNYRWNFSGPGSITFEIRIGNAHLTADGDILISFSHIQEGNGELLIDGRSLELIESRKVNRQMESRYPGALREAQSEKEGMEVRWKSIGQTDDPADAYYVLRWETTGKRRYYKPPDIPVQPSPLILYKLKKTLDDGPEVPWRDLFNGEDLTGWEIVDGQAEPKVVQGILEVQQIDTANFVYLMCTEKFSDYILELDAKLMGELNSGILMRGIRDPHLNNGLSHGFQMEIDQSERKWTGGIYEERGRLWLTPLDGKPEAMEAYKVSDWNHYRIEAIQDTFKIWVNEVPTTYLIDGKTAEGLIGFQIHKIAPGMAKGTLQLKNIRIISDKPQRFSTPISFPLVNTDQ